MRSGIYQIRCLVNGKFYIGSAVNISVRWQGHRWHLSRGSHHNRRLQNAWQKYGVDQFVFEVLEAVEDRGRLLPLEQEYLDRLRPWDHGVGYNIRSSVGSFRGCRHTPETIERMRRPKSPEHIAKLREASRKRNPDTVARIAAATAEANRNRVLTPEQRARLSEISKRRMSDPIFKARLAEISRTRVRSPEERAKRAQANKGRRHTPETRAKMVVLAKQRSADPDYIARMTAAVRAAYAVKKTAAITCEELPAFVG